MEKIRITESDLHTLIKNSVNRVIREMDGDDDDDFLDDMYDYDDEEEVEPSEFEKTVTSIAEEVGFMVGDTSEDEVELYTEEVTVKILKDEDGRAYISHFEGDFYNGNPRYESVLNALVNLFTKLDRIPY